MADIYDRLGRGTVGGGSSSWAVSFEHLREALFDTSAAISAHLGGAADPRASEVPVRPPLGVSVSGAVEPVRVALCDDDLLAQVAVAAMLQSAGWLRLVGIASSTQEIIELAEAKRPEVVVVDWMMPRVEVERRPAGSLTAIPRH